MKVVVNKYKLMDKADFKGKELKNGRYKVSDTKDFFLGSGSFAEVYRAMDKSSGKIVAIKRVLPEKTKSATDRKYLEREIRIMVGLTRPRRAGSMWTAS